MFVELSNTAKCCKERTELWSFMEYQTETLSSDKTTDFTIHDKTEVKLMRLPHTIEIKT